jgi:class 3 adenylate cyclase
MIDAAHRYDGYIVQSTGDGIFAPFGAPVAHEDHPQRALYAALRMQEELRRYSVKLVADGGNPLQCQVGINTGEVVVRSIATGEGHTEYTPIGHTTNLASRMQAVAPVGSIAVAEPTRKLCEGYFVLKSLGPTRVKGQVGRFQWGSLTIVQSLPGPASGPAVTRRRWTPLRLAASTRREPGSMIASQKSSAWQPKR